MIPGPRAILCGFPSGEGLTNKELFELLGYVTAQDRLWQLEVNKRWAKGTLAEIFGPTMVPADRVTRIRGYTEKVATWI